MLVVKVFRCLRLTFLFIFYWLESGFRLYVVVRKVERYGLCFAWFVLDVVGVLLLLKEGDGCGLLINGLS